MADSGAIRAGRAFVELFADDSKLVRGLKAAGGKLKAWGDSISLVGKRIALLGIGALGGLSAAAKAASDLGGSLADMSARTGMSVEGIQELGYAARMTGASTEDLETGVRKMQKTIAQAEAGSNAAQDALAELGLTAGAIASLMPEQQFEAIADRLAAIPDPARRAAAAMEIFGKSGTKLVPMMAGGAAGIEKMRAKARELGLVLSEKDVQAADEFGDTLDTLWESLKVGFARIGIALIPMLTDLAGKIIEISGRVGAWISENQGLIVSAFKIAKGVVEVGAGLFALGKLFSGAGFGMKLIAGVFSTVFSVVGFLAPLFSALVSPVGLVVIAVAGLGAAFLTCTETGRDLLGSLADSFWQLVDDVSASWRAIGSALASGDLASATKVVWALIKMEWAKGVSWMLGTWADAKTSFLNTWADASSGIAKLMVSGFSATQTAWISTTTAMTEAWTMFTTAVGNAWDRVMGWLEKRWIEIKGLIDQADMFMQNRHNTFAGGVDVAAEKAAVDRGTASSITHRNNAENEALIESERAAQARTDAVGDLNRQMVDSINAQAAAEKRRRDGLKNEGLGSLQAEVAAARKEWQDAIAAASTTRPAFAGGAIPGATKPPASLAGVDTTGESKTSAVGTFTGAALWGMGGGTPVTSRLDQIIQHVGRVANNTAKLGDQAAWGD